MGRIPEIVTMSSCCFLGVDHRFLNLFVIPPPFQKQITQLPLEIYFIKAIKWKGVMDEKFVLFYGSMSYNIIVERDDVYIKHHEATYCIIILLNQSW